MRRAALCCVALGLGLLGACSRPGAGDGRVRLAFVRAGQQQRGLSLQEMLRVAPAEEWTGFDPYYGRAKTYRALPLRPLVEAGFPDPGAALSEQEFVLRATDGYTVPIGGRLLLEPGGYLAFADVEVPGWEPIGPGRANPGPLYLVWRRPEQQDLTTHPRPWQLAAIELSSFEAAFPHTVPTAAAAGSPERRGFGLFRQGCLRCHAMNRQGGRVGPDLNVPRSIVEYRPAEQIRQYIRNPLSFRYSNMPAHPHLSEADLDDLLAYLRMMSKDKHDPERPSPAREGAR